MTMQFPEGMFKGLEQGVECPACHERIGVPVPFILDGGKMDCPKCGAHLKSLGSHYTSQEHMRRVAQEGGSLRIDDDPSN